MKTRNSFWSLIRANSDFSKQSPCRFLSLKFLCSKLGFPSQTLNFWVKFCHFKREERERESWIQFVSFFLYLFIWFGLFFDLFLYFRWLICLISVNMAVVSRACCDNATSESIDVCGIRVAGNMESGREIVEEPVARVIEDKIFVAVGKSVKECKLMLLWALQNSGGKRICIIHVLQPSQMIPLSKFKKWKKTNLVYYFIFCYYDSSFF